MGLMDFFRRDDDPQRKLMRMPLRELRSKRIEIDMELKQAYRQVEKLRAEFGELIEKGRASTSDNEQRLLASEAKKARQKMELHQRDFDGLKDALENVDALIVIREGVGDNTQRVEKELGAIVGMSSHEFSKALQNRSAAFESSRIRLKDRDEAVSGYTESRGGEEESPELALMRQGREKSLSRPITPPSTEAAAESKPKKNAETSTEE